MAQMLIVKGTNKRFGYNVRYETNENDMTTTTVSIPMCSGQLKDGKFNDTFEAKLVECGWTEKGILSLAIAITKGKKMQYINPKTGKLTECD